MANAPSMALALGVVPPGVDPEAHELACAHGLIAAADAVTVGQSRGLQPHEIAKDAHKAAKKAYDLYLHLAHHAALDSMHAAEHDREEHEHTTGPVQTSYDLTGMAGATAIERHHGHVGHHGGGGGGHGGHHHDGRGFFGGGGPWYDYGVPVVYYCGPGQVLLADGTCFPPGDYGVTVSGPQVGADLPEGQEGAVYCPMGEDGDVELPDGSRIGLTPFVHAAHASAGAVGPVMTPQGTEQDGTIDGSGYTVGPGGSSTPFPAAGMSGVQTSGNAQVDALNLQWIALAQVVPTCLGPGAQLPNSLAPDIFSTTFSDDYAGWQQFYSDVASYGAASAVMPSGLTGDITGWQAYANAWGMYVRQQCPNVQLPDNFPQGTTGLQGALPSITSLSLPSAKGVASALEWGVIAVLVGVGLWLFWPVLVGARHLFGSP